MISISVKITDAAGAVSTAFALANLTTPPTITIGETAVTSTNDSGNGDLLVAQQATLAQAPGRS